MTTSCALSSRALSSRVSAPGFGLALGFAVLLSLPSAVRAQPSGGSLPLLPFAEQPARTELLDLIRQIQAQLGALPQDPQNSDQVAALRSELEVLVLQAEVEKLQRDNADLEASLAGQLQRATGSSSTPGTPTTGTPSSKTPSNITPSYTALERRIEQLSEQQRNLNAQLSAMAEQHAEMLEQQLSQDATNPAETASAAAPGTTGLSTAPGLRSSRTNAPTRGQNQVQTQTQPQPRAQSRARPRIHTVRPGDSLSRLAVTYYGEAARWPDILAANPQITNPNVLFVGTELTIP